MTDTIVAWHFVPDGNWLDISIFNNPTQSWITVRLWGGPDKAKHFDIAKEYVKDNGEFFTLRTSEQFADDAAHVERMYNQFLVWGCD